MAEKSNFTAEFGFIRTLVSATIGAILILFVWHHVRDQK
jgi:hypothetical protein